MTPAEVVTVASTLVDELGRVGAARVADLKATHAADTRDSEEVVFWARVSRWIGEQWWRDSAVGANETVKAIEVEVRWEAREFDRAWFWGWLIYAQSPDGYWEVGDFVNESRPDLIFPVMHRCAAAIHKAMRTEVEKEMTF